MVDENIENLLQNENPMIEALFNSARYSTAGGKRIRAVYVFLLGNMLSIPNDKLLTIATAIELVHTASLVMDDLPYMDDSQLRRGKPANHVVFGQDVALLTSVGLISKAIEIALTSDALTDEERTHAATLLTRSFGFDGLAAGQFLDLKIRRKVANSEIFKFINQKKNAALLIVAGETCALLGNVNEKQKQAIKVFSENIGLAFQIVDELGELESNDAALGRSPDQERMTFVKWVGIEEAKRILSESIEKADKELSIFGQKAEDLKAFGRYLIQRTS